MILVFENISGLKSYSLLLPPPIINVNPIILFVRSTLPPGKVSNWTLWVINLVFTDALALFPFPPEILISGVST